MPPAWSETAGSRFAVCPSGAADPVSETCTSEDAGLISGAGASGTGFDSSEAISVFPAGAAISVPDSFTAFGVRIY